MKTKLLIVASLALMAGCDKHRSVLSSVSNPTGATYKDQARYYFVGAGQSNMSHEVLSNTFTNSMNVAKGGSPLAAWVKGSEGYGEILTACRTHNGTCVLLFWQGEAEGASQQLYDWSGVFTQTVRDLRADLKYDIPVVFVQIGQTSVAPVPNWAAIQGQQASIARALPGMAMVSAADMFPDTGDGLHYGQDQYAVMQRRMYQAWQSGL